MRQQILWFIHGRSARVSLQMDTRWLVTDLQCQFQNHHHHHRYGVGLLVVWHVTGGPWVEYYSLIILQSMISQTTRYLYWQLTYRRLQHKGPLPARQVLSATSFSCVARHSRLSSTSVDQTAVFTRKVSSLRNDTVPVLYTLVNQTYIRWIDLRSLTWQNTNVAFNFYKLFMILAMQYIQANDSAGPRCFRIAGCVSQVWQATNL